MLNFNKALTEIQKPQVRVLPSVLFPASVTIEAAHKLPDLSPFPSSLKVFDEIL